MNPEEQKEKDYWTLLESTQRQAYPRFVAQLKAQTGTIAEDGRAAVIEFQDGTKPVVRRFRISRHLRNYLKQSQPVNAVPAIRRRVFVLEGLAKNFVQVLGSQLQVPPSLFAAQWAGPGIYRGNLLNRSLRHYDCKSRFVLKSPKIHHARINGLGTDESNPIYYMASSVNHQLSRISLFGDFEAVLLVDPSLDQHVKWINGEIRSVDHDISMKIVDNIRDDMLQNGSWYAPYLFAAPPSNPAAGTIAGQEPGMQSTFEDLLTLYPLEKRPSTTDPKDSVDICRKLVLSAWTAWLRVVEAQIAQEQFRMSTSAMGTAINSKTWLDEAWTRPWQSRQFGRLVRAKSALESIDADIYYNIDALGMGGMSQTAENWEVEAWKSLQYTVQALKAKLDIILQAYTQAVSVQESITSNRQARQVGYLTSLATIFIPISLIAAIFSMGGQFSAGESLFWVYWVIAIPMVVVGCILLFTKLGARILGESHLDGSLV